MIVSIDTKNLTIAIDNEIVFTAPTGWAPVPQIVGELDNMEDAGTIDRATHRRLTAELYASEIGQAHRRTKAWQFGGQL